jgi:hypothetical protein
MVKGANATSTANPAPSAPCNTELQPHASLRHSATPRPRP